jgi:endogenous inhibitor of DNA gyrase (YacG/DUF329 family)
MAVNPGKAVLVKCPVCAKRTAWSAENRFRPFCSERCKQIDLGAWASGEYRIPIAQGDPAQALPTEEDGD